DGVLHLDGDVLVLHDLPLGAQPGQHGLAVVVVDDAALVLDVLLGHRGDGRVRVADGDHAEDAGGAHREARHHDLPVGDETPPAAALPFAALASPGAAAGAAGLPGTAGAFPAGTAARRAASAGAASARTVAFGPASARA